MQHSVMVLQRSVFYDDHVHVDHVHVDHVHVDHVHVDHVHVDHVHVDHVHVDHVHVDHGLSGTTRFRPSFRQALAACRAGDVLVVTKPDRLARPLRDATDIADELTKKGVALILEGAVYGPMDPVGRLLFNVLGMVAEFEADLIRARTREGMAIAKAVVKLRGRKPKLTPPPGEAPRAAARNRRPHD
jgi:DNA invertase Pin-like site-specific DNA recombinase